VGYNVSGTATSASSVVLAGTKNQEVFGDLGSQAPSQVTFTVTKGAAPNPSFTGTQ
jgi:hypothetical protein